MQKIGKKASILIWSIFLSLTLSITFISISTQINKSLKENAKIKEKISVDRFTQKTIKKAVLNKTFDNILLSDNQIIIFDKGNYLEENLKESEDFIIKTLDSTSINIEIKWSPVEYENWDSSISWIVTSSSSKTISLDASDELTIKNLWWYSEVIISWSTPFQSEYKNYKIIEKIWNKDVTKESWKIEM